MLHESASHQLVLKKRKTSAAKCVSGHQCRGEFLTVRSDYGNKSQHLRPLTLDVQAFFASQTGLHPVPRFCPLSGDGLVCFQSPFGICMAVLGPEGFCSPTWRRLYLQMAPTRHHEREGPRKVLSPYNLPKVENLRCESVRSSWTSHSDSESNIPSS